MYDIDNANDVTTKGAAAAAGGAGLLAVRSANQQARKFAKGAKSTFSEAAHEANKASGFGEFKKRTESKVKDQTSGVMNKVKAHPTYKKAKRNMGKAQVILRRRILKGKGL